MSALRSASTFLPPRGRKEREAHRHRSNRSTPCGAVSAASRSHSPARLPFLTVGISAGSAQQPWRPLWAGGRPTSACTGRGPLGSRIASALPFRVAGRAGEARVRWAARGGRSVGSCRPAHHDFSDIPGRYDEEPIPKFSSPLRRYHRHFMASLRAAIIVKPDSGKRPQRWAARLRHIGGQPAVNLCARRP